MVNMRTTRRGRAAWCLQSGDAKSVADEAKKSKLDVGISQCHGHRGHGESSNFLYMLLYATYLHTHIYLYILYVYNLYLCIDV